MNQVFYIDTEYKFLKESGKELTFDNAIEYVKYLRRVENFKEPVLFTSFLSFTEILNKPNTSIIKAIGHDFLQLPYSKSELEFKLQNLKELTDVQLSDIKINFCQLRSSLRESFHIFKGQIREIKGSKIDVKQKNSLILSEFNKFKLDLKRDYGSYPEIIIEFEKVISLYNPKDLNTIDLIDTENEERFSKFLPSDETETEELVSTKKGWKILFLDDRPSELESILQLLQLRNIEFEIATSVIEAKNKIEGDVYNQISVVVSDYRLFENCIEDNNIQRMQPEQGYDFLIWLSKQNRYNALVALSGLSKWFLLDSFRKNNINVKVYSKSGLLGGGSKLFVDDIEYLGAQYNEIVNNQPKATFWNEMQYVDAAKTKIKSYPLKPYYVYHRNNNDYLTEEDTINKIAERLAREVEFAIDKNSNFNFASLVSIQGNATKTMKGEIENEYENFRMKLLQRRVFYYLILKGFDTDAISKMIHKGDSAEEMSISMIKQVPSMLAIQAKTDIPYNLLIEEKFFLHHYMGLPIFNMAEMMNQIYSVINAHLTKYFLGNEKLIKELANYIHTEGDQIAVGCVSMTEVHILMNKIIGTKVLSNNDALMLAIEVNEILESIADLLPNKSLLNNSLKQITRLKESIAKKQ